MTKPHVPLQGRSDLPGQLELPQTDARLAELAKRKAAEPLRPAQPQKPLDVGLFGDAKDQRDLF